MKVSNQIIKKLNNFGYNVKSVINNGEYGTVYDIGNRVLKITKDYSEAASTNKICKKKLKNVCYIFRVFRFKDVKNIYFIEQEKLNVIQIIPFTGHLNTENFSESYNLINNNFELISSVLPQKIQKLSKNILIYAMCFYFSKYVLNILIESLKRKIPIQEFSQNYVDIFVNVCNKYPNSLIKFQGLFNGLKELKNFNINFYDGHKDNAMKNSKGEWVWTDIGNNEEKIKTLETL